MMEFAKTAGGSIPLERVQHYEIDSEGNAVSLGDTFISHFRTCRNPDKFSKKNRKAATA